MVVKLRHRFYPSSVEFESSVISYGSEANNFKQFSDSPFESSVISYGSEAVCCCRHLCRWFESSVISYGSEAHSMHSS